MNRYNLVGLITVQAIATLRGRDGYWLDVSFPTFMLNSDQLGIVGWQSLASYIQDIIDPLGVAIDTSWCACDRQGRTWTNDDES